MQNTYKLNELLHKHGIKEKIRSQFVGTCLLSLKNGLEYSSPATTSSASATSTFGILKWEDTVSDTLSREYTMSASMFPSNT